MFPENVGSALRPYRPRRKRGFVQGGGPPKRIPLRKPAGVVGGRALTTRTKLAPYVGGKAGGGAMVSLPRTKRYANKGTAPTTEPVGPNERRSRQYLAAKKRTVAKFARR